MGVAAADALPAENDESAGLIGPQCADRVAIETGGCRCGIADFRPIEKGINAVADAADADRGMYCRADNHPITRRTDPTTSLRHVLSPGVVVYNPNVPFAS